MNDEIDYGVRNSDTLSGRAGRAKAVIQSWLAYVILDLSEVYTNRTISWSMHEMYQVVSLTFFFLPPLKLRLTSVISLAIR